MGIKDFFRKKTSGNTGKGTKITSGECCVCNRKVFRNPDDAKSLDDAARYCRKCGTDICVQCLKKLEGDHQKICPVCGEQVMFEINPLFRP